MSVCIAVQELWRLGRGWQRVYVQANCSHPYFLSPAMTNVELVHSRLMHASRDVPMPCIAIAVPDSDEKVV